ncbi:hypothetical protein ECEC4448_1680, partial [Escherichia coli EC4448]
MPLNPLTMVFSFWMFARALALLVGTLCGAVCT